MSIIRTMLPKPVMRYLAERNRIHDRAQFDRSVRQGNTDAMVKAAVRLLAEAGPIDEAQALLEDLLSTIADFAMQTVFLDQMHKHSSRRAVIGREIAKRALANSDEVRLARHADVLLRLPAEQIPTPLRFADLLSRIGRHEASLNLLARLYDAGIGPKRACEIAIKIAENSGNERNTLKWARRLLKTAPGHARATAMVARYDYRRRDDAMEAKRLAMIRLRRSGERWIGGNAAHRLMDMGRIAPADHLLTRCATFPGKAPLPELSARIRSGMARGDSAAVLDAARALGRWRQEGRFSVLLKTAADHLRQAGHAADADEVDTLAQIAMAAINQPALEAWFKNLRAELDKVRKPHEAVADPWKVSYLCPIHRPADIPNLIAQIARQVWPNAEAVVVPNGAVTADAIRAAWTIGIPLRIVTCPENTLIGGLLNAAVAASDGDVLMRVDADSLHFPAYTADMVSWLRKTGAALVLKRRGVLLIEDQSRLLVKMAESDIIRAGFGHEGGGATFSGLRRIYEAFPFPEDVYRGEDTLFMQQSIAEGEHIHFVDPFNFLSMRKASGAGHTWDVTEFQLMAGGAWHIAGTAADINRLIVVPRG